VPSNLFPFESEIRRLARNIRQIATRGANAIGYIDQSSQNIPVKGDEHGPYIWPMGRASQDGISGVVTVSDGEPQLLTTDQSGRLYVATVPSGGPLQVEGDIEADLADSATSNPVKIGGQAVDGVPGSPVAAGDRVNAVFDLLGRLGIIPWKYTEPSETTLVADATLAATGAFTASTIINVTQFRRLSLGIRYTPGAAGGFPQILPLGSRNQLQPATTDDNWYGMGVQDGSVAPTLMTGAFPTNVDVTIEPEWGSQTWRQWCIRTEAGNATTDRIRMTVDIDITGLRWLYFLYAEEGVTGTPGSLGLRYSLSS